MPFSRYQIRNEFSLADPELYKSADKDDPEALLEGVAMAGLVGVLRQLGDLAEFAAEIFHDLHEEVMVTATRGHGLLVRVQQLESDFPSIERAFLSQTGHSAFFSSSGVGWHPNLRTEQNLITRGDLPRFVMDSYEECRAPPRLFLLDKFDIGGAGACLKRYTDPSFYKVEASSFEMMSAEAQRDKKTRKTKKKGSQWKNGNTPEVFQQSHVKLHQLLLEERIQNGACEPARRVKLKKRRSKFPFDVENGKGYMEKLISSPPEDKLVHEVPLTMPTDNSGGPGFETFEISMVDPPLGLTTENRSPYESPSVDKMVSREHMDNVPENVPETPVSEMPTSSIGFQAGGSRSESEDEEVEEKHISVNEIEDGYKSDDVASEADDYEDALATMESEIETDAELRANSNPSDRSVKRETSSDSNRQQLLSQSSGSQSASDDESSLIRKKITSFSYSDDTTTTSVDSSQAFACIEIPFHPRVSATDSAVPVDREANFEESTSKDSDSSEMVSNNRLDVNSPKKTEELSVDPEPIIASTSEPREQDNDDRSSNSTLVISHAEEQSFGPVLEKLDICDEDSEPNEEIAYSSSPEKQLTDDFLERKSDPLEAGVSYSGEDETEFKDRETLSVESETKDANAAVCDLVNDGNGDDNLRNLDYKTESKDRESESVNSETKDVDSNESKNLSTCENTELDEKVDFVDSETEAVNFVIEKNEENGLSTAELVIDESGFVQNSDEFVEKKESSEISVISPDMDSVPSYDHSNVQFLDGIHNSLSTTSSELDENDVDNPSAKTESIESGEKKESSEKSVDSPELNSVPSASYDHTNIQDLDSIPTSSVATCGDVNEIDVGGPSANFEILQDESLFVTEKTDQNGPQTDVSLDLDLQTVDHELINQSNALFLESAPDSPVSSSSKCIEQHVESESLNQVDHVEKLENASSSLTDTVLEEEKVDQPHTPSLLRLESVDSQKNVDHETLFDAHESDYSEKVEEFQDPIVPTTSVIPVLEEPSVLNLPQSSSHIDISDLQIEYPSAPVFPGYNMLPELAPINLEEMPPLPPLPPMQWRMGKPQNSSSISRPDGGQHEVNSFPSDFPQIESRPPLDLNEKAANKKAEYEVLPTESSSHTEEDGNSVISSEVKFSEQIVPQPPFDGDRSRTVSTSGREIFWPSSGSSFPPGDDERPNGIRPMKVQRSRTPLIDAVAAHDKSKLRKVSERARPLIPKEEERDAILELRKVSERARPLMPKEEERDTLLEEIRAKSFNLKPAVQTRPSIQGPTTNLRVAAILEKANAIRQAFAGSDDDDDDEDGDDDWSDS